VSRFFGDSETKGGETVRIDRLSASLFSKISQKDLEESPKKEPEFASFAFAAPRFVRGALKSKGRGPCRSTIPVQDLSKKCPSRRHY